MHRVTRGEVILNTLDNQLNELRVTRDEHRDEQGCLTYGERTSGTSGYQEGESGESG